MKLIILDQEDSTSQQKNQNQQDCQKMAAEPIDLMRNASQRMGFDEDQSIFLTDNQGLGTLSLHAHLTDEDVDNLGSVIGKPGGAIRRGTRDVPNPRTIEETTQDVFHASFCILEDNTMELAWDFAPFDGDNGCKNLDKEVIDHLLCWKDAGHGQTCWTN